jgi:hypothetical protein
VGVEGRNLGYRHIVIAAICELDRIATGHFAFAKDSKVEAGATASQEPLDHVSSAESHSELVARHAGLGNKELGSTHPEAVADLNLFLEKPFSREVLPERSRRQIHLGELSPPVLIMLERISVHSLLRTAVHGEVGLLVALKVEPVNPNPALYRGLPY